MTPTGRLVIVVLLAACVLLAIGILFALASPDAVRPGPGRHKAPRWQRARAIIGARRGQPRKNGSQGAGLIGHLSSSSLLSPRTWAHRALAATIGWGRRAPAPVIQPTVIWQPSNVRLIPHEPAHEDTVPVGVLPAPVDDPGPLYTSGPFRDWLRDSVAMNAIGGV